MNNNNNDTNFDSSGCESPYNSDNHYANNKMYCQDIDDDNDTNDLYDEDDDDSISDSENYDKKLLKNKFKSSVGNLFNFLEIIIII